MTAPGAVPPLKLFPKFIHIIGQVKENMLGIYN